MVMIVLLGSDWRGTHYAQERNETKRINNYLFILLGNKKIVFYPCPSRLGPPLAQYTGKGRTAWQRPRQNATAIHRLQPLSEYCSVLEDRRCTDALY
jgi:hypothetical protein